MTTLNELIDRVTQRLDNDNAFYPPQTVADGLNLAQNLICLLNPNLLVKRQAVTVAATSAFIVLRDEAPRCVQLRRVVMGDVATDVPATTNSQLHDLHETTLLELQARRGWFRRTGEVRQWYRLGRTHVGLFPRPLVSTVLTLVFGAIPARFELTRLDDQAELPDAWTSVLAECAVPVLEWREGMVETDKAARQLSDLLNTDAFSTLQRAIGRLQRTSTVNATAQVEGA